MKSVKFEQLECNELTFQELSLSEQESINGGSGIGRAIGWLVGAAVGGLQNAADFIDHVVSNGTYSPCD